MFRHLIVCGIATLICCSSVRGQELFRLAQADEWTEEHRRRLADVVTTIVEGIEGGVFAAAPGEWDSFRRTYEQCAYCEFDSVCPRDRAEHAADKADAPELAVRVALSQVDLESEGRSPR